MKHLIRRTFLTAVTVIVLLGATSHNFANASSCTIDPNLSTWDYDSTGRIAKDRDWKNDDVQTDYWMLALSWAPAFCDNFAKEYHDHQCEKNEFGLIVHGLWAQSKTAHGYRDHPRNCVDTPALSVEIVKEYMCIMPGVRLIQGEWEKHGTCDYENAAAYLEQTKFLYESLNIPTRQDIFRIEKDLNTVKQLIIDLNPNLGLGSEDLKASKHDDERLREVKICYSLTFEPIACP